MFDEYKQRSNQSVVLLVLLVMWYYSPLCPLPCLHASATGQQAQEHLEGWEHVLQTTVPLFTLPVRLEKQLCSLSEVLCACSFSTVTALGLWHLKQQPTQACRDEQQVQGLGCWVPIMDSSSAAILCLMVSSKLLVRFFSSVCMWEANLPSKFCWLGTVVAGGGGLL